MEHKDLVALIDEQKRAFEEFKLTLKTQGDEIKTWGAADALTKSKLDRMADVIAEIETKLSRPNLTINVEEKSKDTQSAEVRAYEKFVRFGTKGNRCVDRMDAEEKAAWVEINRKALSESNDGQGGFFVPEDMRTEIIKRIPSFSNVGALVTRQNTSRDVLRYPRVVGGDDLRSSAVSVVWEDETSTATETDFSLGSIGIPVKKARCIIRVANDLLEDAAVDVIGLIQNLAAEAFGIDEDNVLTLAADPRKPEGFMTNAGIASVNSGSGTTVTYAGLVNLVYALAEQYAGNARHMVRRTTIAEFLKLVDGQNRPLWQPALTAGAPSTLIGYPISVNEHMPAVAAGVTPHVFGDFKRLVVVADRAGMTVKRLDEKYADSDETAFIFRRRMGARVTQPWAAKKQLIAA